ncbi:hypothetical protein S83_009364 [Arachis hypogaea]
MIGTIINTTIFLLFSIIILMLESQTKQILNTIRLWAIPISNFISCMLRAFPLLDELSNVYFVTYLARKKEKAWCGSPNGSVGKVSNDQRLVPYNNATLIIVAVNNFF